MRIIGVDPGASETGIVLRDGDTLVAHRVVARGNLPTGPYLRTVLDRIEALDCGVLAVEGVQAPTPPPKRRRGETYLSERGGKIEEKPTRRVTNVTGILGTAQVLGAILGRYRHALEVEPAKHGAAPLAAYPPALRPKTGQGKGKDQLRHCRSAWDVAGAGMTVMRMQQREVG